MLKCIVVGVVTKQSGVARDTSVVLGGPLKGETEEGNASVEAWRGTFQATRTLSRLDVSGWMQTSVRLVHERSVSRRDWKHDTKKVNGNCLDAAASRNPHGASAYISDMVLCGNAEL